MLTPRQAAEKAFYECEGNTQQSLKEALDAYEAAIKAARPVVRRARNLDSAVAA